MIGIFIGLQGTGKTLSMVHYAEDFLTQKQRVVSNFPFTLRFTDPSQRPIFMEGEDLIFELYTATHTTFLIDEGHEVFDSRSWGSHDLGLLRKFTKARKAGNNLYLASQSFSMVEKRLREICNEVIMCQKVLSLGQMNIFRNVHYNPDLFNIAPNLIASPLEQKFITARRFIFPYRVKKLYKIYDTLFMTWPPDSEEFLRAKKRYLAILPQLKEERRIMLKKVYGIGATREERKLVIDLAIKEELPPIKIHPQNKTPYEVDL